METGHKNGFIEFAISLVKQLLGSYKAETVEGVSTDKRWEMFATHARVRVRARRTPDRTEGRSAEVKSGVLDRIRRVDTTNSEKQHLPLPVVRFTPQIS